MSLQALQIAVSIVFVSVWAFAGQILFRDP